MAPANTKVKKATKKKGGTRRQAELDEENRRNAELESQIQDEIGRAQGAETARKGASGLEEEEEEIEDVMEQEEGTTSRSLAFSFGAPQSPLISFIFLKIRL